MDSFTQQSHMPADHMTSWTYGLKTRIMAAVLCVASLFALSSCDNGRAKRIAQLEAQIAELDSELAAAGVITVVGGILTGGAVAIPAGTYAAGVYAKRESLQAELNRLKSGR